MKKRKVKYVRFATEHVSIDCINSSRLISNRVCIYLLCAFLVSLVVFFSSSNIKDFVSFEWEKTPHHACVHEMEIEAYASNYL